MVVGGGIAGISAAVVLAERGVAVTFWRLPIISAAGWARGRERLPDGSEQDVEHGFHAFFRHYYTWRSILRRVDPALSFLRAGRRLSGDLSDVAGRGPDGAARRAAAEPARAVAALEEPDPPRAAAAPTPMRAGHCWPTTAAHHGADFDNVDAAAFLDSLGMTERTRSMLFEAFARSFFCNQGELSAAELVAMFHYYFLGNPEGIGFDVPDTDYATAIWNPLRTYSIGTAR